MYFQSKDINPDVDLNQRLPVVHAQKETVPVWKSMKADRKAIINAVIGKLHNGVARLDIELSARNAGHLISSAAKRGIGGKAHIAAVRNIGKLMKVAARVKSYADQDGQQDVKRIHRFYAPMEYDNAVYAVNMLVKEYSGDRDTELESVHKLYDMKLERKMPDRSADEASPIGHARTATGISEITLGELLSAVKPEIYARTGGRPETVRLVRKEFLMKRFYIIGFLVLMSFDTLAQISFKQASLLALPAEADAAWLFRLFSRIWIYGAVAGYLGAFITWMTLLKYAPVGPSFAASHLELISVTLLSVWIFGEELNVCKIAGGLLILLGVLCLAEEGKAAGDEPDT
ncbi:MAG: EamA family transporter [Desulfovibrio sp.]|jgi:multidrug transporter EmrE-like cation transporter|nr:EamA family transporter [Desulfovibrio sp.]